MRKITGIIILAFFAAVGVQAQDTTMNAIGIRIGPPNPIGDEGFGPEITYQRSFSENTRIDLNLGLRTNTVRNTFRAGALFHFKNDLAGNFDWFAGPGLGVARTNYKGILADDFFGEIDEASTFLYIVGEFGVEYVFDFPLQVAVSIRPGYDFYDVPDIVGYDEAKNFTMNIGISARYLF